MNIRTFIPVAGVSIVLLSACTQYLEEPEWSPPSDGVPIPNETVSVPIERKWDLVLTPNEQRTKIQLEIPEGSHNGSYANVQLIGKKLKGSPKCATVSVTLVGNQDPQAQEGQPGVIPGVTRTLYQNLEFRTISPMALQIPLYAGTKPTLTLSRDTKGCALQTQIKIANATL